MTRWLTMAVLLWISAAGALLGGELVVDDFDDGDLRAPAGLSWLPITDELMGGPSRGSLRWISADGGRGGAMAFEAEVGSPGPTTPVTFAGAWAPITADSSPADLRAYTGLRIRARARQGSFLAGVRRAGRNVSFMAPLDLGPEWKELEVPFEAMMPLAPPNVDREWSAADLAWVGFASALGQVGEVLLEVDEIAFVGGPGRTSAPAPVAGFAGFRVATTLVADAAPLSSLPWELLAEEEAGDGSAPSLPDVTALSWAPAPGGMVWFRLALASAPPATWFGVNVAFDIDGDPANGMAWWGSNSSFHFDRLITAYLTAGSGEWQGALGVADHEAAARGEMDSITGDVRVAVDRRDPALLVGVPGSALPGGRPIRLIATVGSSMLNNDDLPNDGAAPVILGARR